jgi:hypothetical protein
MGAGRRHVILKARRGIAASPVEHNPRQRNLVKHLRSAADVVGVIVASEAIVDVGDAELLEGGDGLVAVLRRSIIEKHDLRAGRDQDSPIALPYVHEVDPKVSVCLRKNDHCGEKNIRHRE